LGVRRTRARACAKQTIENRGQQWNRWDLTASNFPGGENVFAGDDYWD
jgi:hypothetical protein